MPEFSDIALHQLGKIVTGKTPPTNRPELLGAKAAFITPTDIEEGSIFAQVSRRLSAAGEAEFHRSLLPPGAVCFTCIASIGKMCMTREPSLTNQQINSIVVDQSQFDPRWVFYMLKSIRKQIAAIASGSATPIINKTSFGNVRTLAPPLDTQRRIASILGAYDDLIEVNQRRVAVLEGMARGLFEEWFVRFRFPGHESVPLVDTPDGPLPQGWSLSPISAVYDGLFDGPHATPPPSTEGAVFLGIGNVTETGRVDLSSVRHIAEQDLTKWTKRVTPQEGDIVFTYEATLNRYALIPKGFRGCLGRRMALIRCNSTPGMNRYLYHYFFTAAWREVIARNKLSGATVDRVPLTRFPEFPVLLPSATVLRTYDAVARPIVKQVDAIERSNRVLFASRDLLLPRLISGQLSVKAAERELDLAA